MRQFLAICTIVIALSLAGNAYANGSKKFASTVSKPITTSVKVEVTLGEDLAYRANNLPKDFRERRSSRLSAAFANKGFYGERELERLANRLQVKMENRLDKSGIDIDANAPTILRLVITDARPNRPTLSQMSKDISLSHKSYGTGGAAITGELVTVSGESLGTLSYAWYETNFTNAAYSNTWSDSHRTFDRFARKVTKNIK